VPKHLCVLRALDELRAGLKRSVDEVAGPDSGEIRQKIGLGKRNCVVEELAAGGAIGGDVEGDNRRGAKTSGGDDKKSGIS
jgi:hypothetical protein